MPLSGYQDVLLRRIGNGMQTQMHIFSYLLAPNSMKSFCRMIWPLAVEPPLEEPSVDRRSVSGR
jgi:hypothetical protein